MHAFNTHEEMKSAWINETALDYLTNKESHDVYDLKDAKSLAEISYRSVVKYVPHIYRGGQVIIGFGYSLQRIIDGYVTLEKAGDPELVEAELKKHGLL